MAALHRFGKVDRDTYEYPSIWRESSTDQIATLRLCASRPCHATGSEGWTDPLDIATHKIPLRNWRASGRDEVCRWVWNRNGWAGWP